MSVPRAALWGNPPDAIKLVILAQYPGGGTYLNNFCKIGVDPIGVADGGIMFGKGGSRSVALETVCR